MIHLTLATLTTLQIIWYFPTFLKNLMLIHITMLLLRTCTEIVRIGTGYFYVISHLHALNICMCFIRFFYLETTVPSAPIAPCEKPSLLYWKSFNRINILKYNTANNKIFPNIYCLYNISNNNKEFWIGLFVLND